MQTPILPIKQPLWLLPWLDKLAIASVFSWLLVFPFYGPALELLFREDAMTMGHIFTATFILFWLIIDFVDFPQRWPGTVSCNISAVLIIVSMTAILLWFQVPTWFLYFGQSSSGAAAAYLVRILIPLFRSQKNPAYCIAIILIVSGAGYIPTLLENNALVSFLKFFTFLLSFSTVFVLLYPPEIKNIVQITKKASEKPDRNAVRGIIIGFALFVAAYLLSEAVVLQVVLPAVKAVSITWPWFAFFFFAIYSAAVVLLALYSTRHGYTALAGCGLSAVGIGTMTFILSADSRIIAQTSFLFQSAGLAGMDLFFWLSLWSLARMYDTAKVIVAGVAGYFVLASGAHLIVEMSWGGGLTSDPMAAFVLIVALFLSIPFVFRSAVLLSAFQNVITPAAITSVFAKQLTAAEQLVFDLLLNGCQDRDIAEKLSISQNTVKFHVRNILRKAKARNRYELLATITRTVR